MAGLAAYGCKLLIGTSTGAEIANVTNISGPGLETETIDVTAHDSGSAYREIVPSFKSGGEFELELNFDPDETTHSSSAGGLLYLWDNKTRQQFTIQFTDATPTKWNFYAYVTGFEIEAPYDDKLSATVTLMVDGGYTWSGT
jgi:hypothetical protein